MNRRSLLLCLSLVLPTACSAPRRGPVLTHSVYFTLTDPDHADDLVHACRERLGEAPGVVAFAAGTRGSEFQRELNDKDFHVALHLWFADRAAHDRYQVSKPHQALLADFAPLILGVRVFDAWAVDAR